MSIIKTIEKNKKIIIYVAFIVILAFLGIRGLNSHYKKQETIKEKQYQTDNQANNQNNVESEITENKNDNIVAYSTETKSIPKTIEAFVYYCNIKDVESAYKMLTDECKNAMFPTVDDFKQIYVDYIFDIDRTYKLDKWIAETDKVIYLITLYGDILATGNTDDVVQDYYTIIKQDNGVYRLNINSYIYGKKIDSESTYNDITVKIENIDVYEDREGATITITNNSNKVVCIKGNTPNENVYIESKNNRQYSLIDGLFNIEDSILQPHSAIRYDIEYNKSYSLMDKAEYLVFNDVILDYNEYLDSINNNKPYNNRTSIKINY